VIESVIERFIDWVFNQGSALIGFFVGVASSYVFIKKVNDQRFESLEKSIAFLKGLLDKTKKDVDEADSKCERRVREVLHDNERLQKRVQSLEDSRMFILMNHSQESDQ